MESFLTSEPVAARNTGIHARIEKAANYAHRTVEKSAGLIEQAELPEKTDQARKFIRQHPLKSVGVTLLVGLVLGLVF